MSSHDLNEGWTLPKVLCRHNCDTGDGATHRDALQSFLEKHETYDVFVGKKTSCDSSENLRFLDIDHSVEVVDQ